MRARNVFSEKSDVSILVHTKSYLENEFAMSYFEKANLIEGIHISFLPVIGEDAKGVITGEYSHVAMPNRILSVLKFENCSGVIKIHNMPDPNTTEAEYDVMTERSLLQGKCASQLFDYIVSETTKPDPLDCEVPIVSFQECCEILRLRMVCCGDYHISEKFLIEETLYYIYRHKFILPAYQTFWSCCVNEGDLDWANALDNRLNLLVRCLDQCKIATYKKTDNNSIMHIKYHLSYLLLLITGTLDNIAWLMNDLYKLDLEKEPKGHFNVDLKKTAFHKAILQKSSNAHSAITNDQFQNRLDAIRELRDRIVHRDFFEAFRGGKAGSRVEVSYFDADGPFYEKLKAAGFQNSDVAIRTESRNLIYMIPFINFLEKVTVEMVNELIKIMTKDIFGKEETVVLWKMLGFPCAPYVL